MENTAKINSFNTPIDTLYAIIKYREEKLKTYFGYFEPAYPEEILNMSGYMHMDMQQYEKAKMYFEFAIQYYPSSANALDSMAEYYERNNNFVQALKFVNKAYVMQPNTYYKERIEKLKLDVNKETNDIIQKQR